VHEIPIYDRFLSKVQSIPARNEPFPVFFISNYSLFRHAMYLYPCVLSKVHFKAVEYLEYSKYQYEMLCPCVLSGIDFITAQNISLPKFPVHSAFHPCLKRSSPQYISSLPEMFLSTVHFIPAWNVPVHSTFHPCLKCAFAFASCPEYISSLNKI